MILVKISEIRYDILYISYDVERFFVMVTKFMEMKRALRKCRVPQKYCYGNRYFLLLRSRVLKFCLF